MRAVLWMAAFGAAALAPTASRASDAVTFKNLHGASFTVSMTTDGHPVLGATVTEKRSGDTICWRSVAAGPKTKPVVECFRKAETGSAQAVYDALRTPAVTLGFTTSVGGFPFVGASTRQKRDGSLMCRQTTPSVPDPTSSYTCYAR